MKQLYSLALTAMALVALALIWVPAFAQQSCQNPDKINLFWDKAAQGTGIGVVDHTEVHRADIKCSTATVFTKVYAGAFDILTFQDINVASGSTYCYVAYNYGTDGTQSGPSNKVECAVPFRAPPVVPNLRLQ